MKCICFIRLHSSANMWAGVCHTPAHIRKLSPSPGWLTCSTGRNASFFPLSHSTLNQLLRTLQKVRRLSKVLFVFTLVAFYLPYMYIKQAETWFTRAEMASISIILLTGYSRTLIYHPFKPLNPVAPVSVHPSRPQNFAITKH